MTATTLNANINGAAAITPLAAFVVTALGPVAIAAAFVSTIGFTGWINRALNNGRGSLRLNLGQNLGQDFIDGLLRNRPRSNWHGGKRSNLHGIPSSDRRDVILPALYQKNINHFMLESTLDKLLIFNLFSLVKGNATELSVCSQVSKS
jgi:hypothetical protein